MTLELSDNWYQNIHISDIYPIRYLWYVLLFLWILKCKWIVNPVPSIFYKHSIFQMISWQQVNDGRGAMPNTTTIPDQKVHFKTPLLNYWYKLFCLRLGRHVESAIILDLHRLHTKNTLLTLLSTTIALLLFEIDTWDKRFECILCEVWVQGTCGTNFNFFYGHITQCQYVVES